MIWNNKVKAETEGGLREMEEETNFLTRIKIMLHFMSKRSNAPTVSRYHLIYPFLIVYEKLRYQIELEGECVKISRQIFDYAFDCWMYRLDQRSIAFFG